MASNPDLKRTISKLSWGIADSLSNFLLYNISLITGFASVSGKTAKAAYKGFQQTDKIYQELSEKIKPSQLKLNNIA